MGIGRWDNSMVGVRGLRMRGRDWEVGGVRTGEGLKNGGEDWRWDDEEHGGEYMEWWSERGGV